MHATGRNKKGGATAESDGLDQLVRAARAGDEPAYRRLLTEIAARLRGYFAGRTATDADAEDLIQECLIAMHDRLESYDARRPFPPWMFAIARYKLIDHYRRSGRMRTETIGDDIAGVDETGAALASHDLDKLLGTLPQGQREAIRLMRIEGLTSAEAGARLGIGVSAVKVRVHRGMAGLRAALDKDGG